MSLRVCSVCGLEAYTEADLELFVGNWSSRHGRQNRCKRCERKRVSQTLDLIKIFRARSPDGLIRCHYCEEEVTKLEGRSNESLHIHSLDGDHENWSPENKVPAHGICHQRGHKVKEDAS